MQVTNALVEKLAHLSRLDFEDHEKEAIRKDLEKMIAFVDKLQELDTDGVKPLLHMTSAINVYREDEVKGSVSREEALKEAPGNDGEFFVVPKVISK
jgi:aspartyl-tRNA(Asn)/glutamyl-tRNA(Gln) amidotransferase subunit C